jgi:hypothetical protein
MGMSLGRLSVQSLACLAVAFVVSTTTFTTRSCKIPNPTTNITCDSVIDWGFSILMPTLRRRLPVISRTIPELVAAKISGLERIFVNWCDVTPLPSLAELGLSSHRLGTPVTVIPTNSTSLSSSFLVPEGLKTRTVLVMHDDLSVNPDDISNAFLAYRAVGARNRVFGASFAVRGCWNGLYRFDGRNIILTKFAFLDVRMLKLYAHVQYQAQREFVDRLWNCEDILVNYIVTVGFHSASVSFPVRSKERARSGLSNKGGHMEKRHICCKEFERKIGPLLNVVPWNQLMKHDPPKQSTTS